MKMERTKLEKGFTSLSAEQQKAIRGWGAPKPPRIKIMTVPNRRQK